MASCGGDNGGTPDGSQDGTLPDGGGGDGAGGDGANTGDGGGCLVGCDSGTCTPLGAACTISSDCCSGDCNGGSCQPAPCTSDNQKCTTSAQCCSGTCGTGGTCTPLNTTCKTLGNACTSGTECCSTYCHSGICSQPSYCGQAGDICATGADCCGGVCTKSPTATYGTCAQPPQGGAQCSAIDGVVCAGTTADGGISYIDSGLPACGGACCSRDCAPWGPTQVLICQPASGCKPVGDICYKNDDCCGGSGPSPTQVCQTVADGGPGTCHNPTGCKPNGDICRLQSMSCNATDNCCSGNVQNYDTCHQDSLGVPRCSYAGDAGCIPLGSDAGCSSSADCCNLDPCVPNGDAGYTCYPGPCVPVKGPCTNDGDCCVGGHCYIPGGQTTGSCAPNNPDAGVTDSGTPADAGCALYGQTCTTSSDCCNGIPCTDGRCIIPIN